MTHDGSQPSMIVCAHHVAVGYGTKVVVDEIDTDLVAGGSVALVGSNGSGKSTLLKTLAGLIPPIAGDIDILGRSIGEMTRSVAYLGQYHRNLQRTGTLTPARVAHRCRGALGGSGGWGRGAARK